MPDNTKKRAYHHGELRDTLINAAWDTINSRGVESFTIVAAAQQAGVSKAAPYRHFKDRDALIKEVVLKGFEQLADQVRESTASEHYGSTEKVIAGGLAYLRFFHSYPIFFDLMFRVAPAIDQKSSEEPESLKMTCMQQHLHHVHEWSLVHLKQVDEPQVVDLAMKLWATVHGLTSLSINQHLSEASPYADVDEMLRSFTVIFLDGIRMNTK